VYTVGADLKSRIAGLITFENISDKPMSQEVPLAVFDSNDLILEDVSVGRPKVRWVERDTSKAGRFQVYWTPDKPIPAGGFHVFAWMSPRVHSLEKSAGGLNLKMANVPGPQCLESFFLILPKDMTVSDPSSKWSSYKQIDGFNIYCWRDEVRANTKHEVGAILKTPRDPATQPVNDLGLQGSRNEGMEKAEVSLPQGNSSRPPEPACCFEQSVI
jgi:hypothetical protein